MGMDGRHHVSRRELAAVLVGVAVVEVMCEDRYVGRVAGRMIGEGWP